MTYTPTPAMLARVDHLHSYGGIVRGKWQDTDEQGREIACWLGALDPEIDGAEAVAVEAAAAEAAARAAWDQIAGACLSAIEAECDAAEGRG
jgi:hypothetical protein